VTATADPFSFWSSTSGNEVTVPAGTQPRYSVEAVLTVLHESHDVSAYEAVERLVYAAEAAGFDPDVLLAMIDQGIAFEKVLETIVSKATCSQKVA
jgi:hypothetical protein